MTSFADGSAQAFEQLDAAQTGVGSSLASQHDVTAEERQALNADTAAYKADVDPRLAAGTRGRVTEATQDMLSAHKIGQAYKLWTEEEKQAYIEDAAKQPLGNVEDPAERMKAMSFLTQEAVGPDGQPLEVDKSVCSGAAIVGAAFLAEGPDGLKKVMGAIEAQDPNKWSTDPKSNAEYKKIKDKLDGKDKTPLTVADIQALQRTTYEVLRAGQPEGMVPDGAKGVHSDHMNAFMAHEGSEQLREMMKKNNMTVEGIDNDGVMDRQGNRAMDHYVVRIKGPDGKEAIYDPSARRGGQMIDFKEGVDHYTRARAMTVQN